MAALPNTTRRSWLIFNHDRPKGRCCTCQRWMYLPSEGGYVLDTPASLECASCETTYAMVDSDSVDEIPYERATIGTAHLRKASRAALRLVRQGEAIAARASGLTHRSGDDVLAQAPAEIIAYAQAMEAVQCATRELERRAAEVLSVMPVRDADHWLKGAELGISGTTLNRQAKRAMEVIPDDIPF